MITEINKEALALNAKLQQKKNKLRTALGEKGILNRGGENKYDNYKYFTEAQYKELFTDLFTRFGLELKFTELEYDTFEGSEKQRNGRLPKLMFSLFDIETGYYEETVITGEGMDKGDKAGYKAYTGALKYYLANTFMVATGEDPEGESPDEPMNKRKRSAEKIDREIPKKLSDEPKAEPKKASDKQVEILRNRYKGENLAKLLQANGLEKLEDISMAKASELIGLLSKRSQS